MWAAPRHGLPDKVVTLPLNHWLTYVINQNQLYRSIYPVTERHWVSHWQKLIKICIAHCQKFQYTVGETSYTQNRMSNNAPLDLFVLYKIYLYTFLFTSRFDSVMIGFSCFLTVHSEVCFQAESVFIDHDGSLHLLYITVPSWSGMLLCRTLKY